METQRADSQIRVWPGMLIVALQWLAVFGIGVVAPATPAQFFGMVAGPPVGLLLIFLWWGAFSRAPKLDRLLGVVVPLVVLAIIGLLAHPSMVPMTLFVYGLSAVCMAFVLCVWLTKNWRNEPRRLALVAAILVAGGGWALVRSEGVDGNMAVDFSWRWQQTAEERLLAAESELPPPVIAATSPTPPAESKVPGTAADSEVPGSQDSEDRADSAVPAESELPESEVPESEVPGTEDTAISSSPNLSAPASAWPGFRGLHRDSVVEDLRIATDWQTSPPQELWRRAVGPGWGSFVTAYGLVFTQEQRGDDEVVSAYQASSGEPVWRHRDNVRFWESLAGAGPRATPMVHEGRLYSLGATGLLNALRASDGAFLWRRDVALDTSAPTPEWGFSSSPLVIDGLVVVHTGGPNGKGIAAYDALTGEPRWFAPAGPLSYSSAHLTTLDGVPQLVVLTGDGAASYTASDGAVLWQHEWPMPSGARIVQPAFTNDGGVLIGTGFGMGLRRLDIQSSDGDWQIEERWTTTGMKPYFNDLVAHRGHAYGFDGRILSAVDLTSGERAWKGGRYGHGQLILLPGQDLLLVLSDRGDVALVAAKPEGFTELARMPAIKGKTWNHPMLVDGILFVRNGEEMAAFQMPVRTTVADRR